MKRKNSKIALAIATASTGLLTASVQAQETTSTTNGIVRITHSPVANGPACPLTPHNALVQERARVREFIGPLLGTLFAGIAGDLVQSGISALGTALEDASKSRGFVAEGVGSYNFGQIRKATLPDPGEPTTALDTVAAYAPREHCLILYVPSGEGTFGDFLYDKNITDSWSFSLNGTKTDGPERAATLARLNDLGFTSMPHVYLEAVVLPAREAMIVRPTFVWYRSRYKDKAPTDLAATELHVTFATPGFDANKPTIGVPFASVRIKLPKMKPEGGKKPKISDSVKGPKDLAGYQSVWVPLRPQAGGVKTTLDAYNAALNNKRTKDLEKLQKDRAYERSLKASGSGADAKRATAKDAKEDAERAAKLANAQTSALKDSIAVGATNAEMRFVVIRDENKFLQALGKAIKGQAEDAGKAVVEELKPKPAFTANDTAYLEAILKVESDQRAYERALEEGDNDKIAEAFDMLRVSKAKANEAAVASSRPLPYAGLLGGL